MKSELEIRDEIEAVRRSIINIRSEFKEGNLPKEQLRPLLVEHQSTLNALKWVLGENERYD